MPKTGARGTMRKSQVGYSNWSSVVLATEPQLSSFLVTIWRERHTAKCLWNWNHLSVLESLAIFNSSGNFFHCETRVYDEKFYTTFWASAWLHSGGATPGRPRANALAEIPPPWLQSKVVIIKLYLTALADATIDLSMPCHEQRTGAATVDWPQIFSTATT